MFLRDGSRTIRTVRAHARRADRALAAALRDCGADARIAAVTRGLSHSGEHAALWLAAGLTGAVTDPARRPRWLRGTALVAVAHLAAMGVKRAVRRPRPGLPGLPPLVGTVGRHSFPSCHATSAAAAAVAFGTLPPAGRWASPLAAAVCVSRLVAGVHYPSDVAAGAALGALTARLGGRAARLNGLPGPSGGVPGSSGGLPDSMGGHQGPAYGLPGPSDRPAGRPGGPAVRPGRPGRRARATSHPPGGHRHG